VGSEDDTYRQLKRVTREQMQIIWEEFLRSRNWDDCTTPEKNQACREVLERNGWTESEWFDDC